MQTITEIINTNENTKHALLLNQIAAVLNCSVEGVHYKIKRNGAGMVYTRGLIQYDSERHRERLVEMYGEIIVITTTGEVLYIDKHNFIQLNRQLRATQKRAKVQAEKAAEKQAIKERRAARKTQKIFKNGQQYPSPKKQGQAKTLSALGQYVNFRGLNESNTTPTHRDILRTIRISD